MRTEHKTVNLMQAQNVATLAAREAGAMMRRNLRSDKKANEITQHDIKLELDVRCQELIERRLVETFPGMALLGEEGVTGNPRSDWRWVVDPIDGTVNFAYGIPHACVSIALQHLGENPNTTTYEDGYHTEVGVVYDPFCDELWTARLGQAARLNSRPIQVSRRPKLAEAILSIGFAKSSKNLDAMLPYFTRLVHRVRKIRITGSAALALTYVATGRFDAYIEQGIRIWDIAAGGFITEQAGGEFWRQATGGDYAYRMVASNGLLRKKLAAPIQS